MTFPEPVISMAVEPKTKSDQERWAWRWAAWRRRSVVPRPHRRGIRPDHHRRHGRAAPGHHRRPHEAREFNVEANVGKPQVAYRETIRKSDVKSDYKHAKQSGRSGQYGHVVIRYRRR